jgi:hypothetical protein
MTICSRYNVVDMSRIGEIEQAVQELTPAELTKFRDWFVVFDAARWDMKFEEDVARGKLESLGNEALANLAKGLTTEL